MTLIRVNWIFQKTKPTNIQESICEDEGITVIESTPPAIQKTVEPYKTIFSDEEIEVINSSLSTKVNWCSIKDSEEISIG